MTRRRAQYLRRAIHRLRTKERRCPKCRRGVLTTDKLDATTLADHARGERVILNGWTTCDRCDHRQTEPVT